MQDTIPTLSASEVFRSLEARPEGLTSIEAETRLRRDGTNTIRDVRGPRLYVKLIANFTHLMALLLWTGGIIAFVAQLPQLGWAIWAGKPDPLRI
jgi:P-type Ca2+ transporter type 2C